MAQLERYFPESGGEYLASEVKKRTISVELTQAEYDALSDAEKNSDTVYYITDAGSGNSGSSGASYDDTEIRSRIEALEAKQRILFKHSLIPGAYDENWNYLKSWKSLFADEDPVYGRRVRNNVFSGEECAWDALSGVSIVVVDPSIVSFGRGNHADGQYQFILCEDLKRIVLPDTLLDLGEYSPFSFCSNLEEINLPDGIPEIPVNCFWGCSSLKEIHLPDSITKIYESAFGETGLLDISFPPNVVEIEGGAFWGCESLVDVTIPNSVTTIGRSAFRGCTSLVEISIPNSVTSIGESVFEDCSNLTTIHYSGTATGAPWGAPNAVVVP